MKSIKLFAALAIGIALVPVSAQADDPNDPAMRDPRARARDAEMIRQMNRDMLAQVRERDAQYAQGWSEYRDYPARNAEYQAAMAAHARSKNAYERDRSQYEQDMADWRRAVEMCRAGHYEYCRG